MRRVLPSRYRGCRRAEQESLDSDKPNWLHNTLEEMLVEIHSNDTSMYSTHTRILLRQGKLVECRVVGRFAYARRNVLIAELLPVAKILLVKWEYLLNTLSRTLDRHKPQLYNTHTTHDGSYPNQHPQRSIWACVKTPFAERLSEAANGAHNFKDTEGSLVSRSLDVTPIICEGYCVTLCPFFCSRRSCCPHRE